MDKETIASSLMRIGKISMSLNFETKRNNLHHTDFRRMCISISVLAENSLVQLSSPVTEISKENFNGHLLRQADCFF